MFGCSPIEAPNVLVEIFDACVGSRVESRSSDGGDAHSLGPCRCEQRTVAGDHDKTRPRSSAGVARSRSTEQSRNERKRESASSPGGDRRQRRILRGDMESNRDARRARRTSGGSTIPTQGAGCPAAQKRINRRGVARPGREAGAARRVLDKSRRGHAMVARQWLGPELDRCPSGLTHLGDNRSIAEMVRDGHAEVRRAA